MKEWVRVRSIDNQPLAEMLLGMLQQDGLRAFAKSSSWTVPHLGASAPHDIWVWHEDEAAAKKLLDEVDAGEAEPPGR
ncbi:MAG: DUF2007 domain-containing protein [Thermaerobacterales bacterium]